MDKERLKIFFKLKLKEIGVFVGVLGGFFLVGWFLMWLGSINSLWETISIVLIFIIVGGAFLLSIIFWIADNWEEAGELQKKIKTKIKKEEKDGRPKNNI